MDILLGKGVAICEILKNPDSLLDYQGFVLLWVLDIISIASKSLELTEAVSLIEPKSLELTEVVSLITSNALEMKKAVSLVALKSMIRLFVLL